MAALLIKLQKYDASGDENRTGDAPGTEPFFQDVRTDDGAKYDAGLPQSDHLNGGRLTVCPYDDQVAEC